jgi:rubrerythrin
MHDSNPYPTLAELDRDGAIREAASRVDGVTRAAFMRRTAALLGGGLAAGAVLPGIASAQTSGDVAILNYALTLEYLEAAFYAEAKSKGALKGELANFASVVAEHEAAHVDALKKALGSKAVKKPAFDFKGTTGSSSTFSATSAVLEDTGVGAYLGQAGNIKTPAVAKAALSILPVEARHAAWVRDIAGSAPAPNAFEPAKTMSAVLAAVQGTGFIRTMGSASAGSGSAVTGQPAMTG